ncbi:hypothetical protein [uncultured Mediterranean phage uvMED]|nr:hypothetical protein [uncultured Mediterranean phage uvMED]
MATLYTKIKLYLEANSKTWDDDNIVLENNGDGDYIKTWNVTELDKPSDEQLTSYETAANTEETNLQTEEANKETKKASGKQKLLDLGLTEEEVKALIGV